MIAATNASRLRRSATPRTLPTRTRRSRAASATAGRGYRGRLEVDYLVDAGTDRTPRGIHPHAVDERVSLPSVLRTAQTPVLFVADWCGVERR
jgi:hypothetical protein